MEDGKETPNSGEGTGAQGAGEAEALKNVKAEFTRKLSNVEGAFAEMKKQNEILLSQIQKLGTQGQPPQAQGKKASDVLYEDPDAFVNMVLEQAESRIGEKLSRRDEKLTKQNATIQNLVKDFPELADGSHEFTQRALEIYNDLPADDKESPVAYRDAVKTAALELGIRPKSKRDAAGDDDFTLTGSGASSGRSSRTKEPKLSPQTEAFAEAMGLKLNKEMKERLASAHGRDSYRKWS